MPIIDLYVVCVQTKTASVQLPHPDKILNDIPVDWLHFQPERLRHRPWPKETLLNWLNGSCLCHMVQSVPSNQFLSLVFSSVPSSECSYEWDERRHLIAWNVKTAWLDTVMLANEHRESRTVDSKIKLEMRSLDYPWCSCMLSLHVWWLLITDTVESMGSFTFIIKSKWISC